ncbi:uncharacterized protein [Aegilops tauschii subsp. strangulata]|uniref:uncharacterized protein n=1 Tax=Aegilops tauschii subsp. strangulata TaxID=200361 RepID=UPI00098A3CE6
MASPQSSNSNPFAGLVPDATAVRDLDIHTRVPIKLDQSTSSYYAWKIYFNLVFREYHLLEHVDGTVDGDLMVDDPDWAAIEASLIRWFYLTVSPDIFHTVVSEDDDASAVWTKINNFFTDNKLQRLVFLQQEFFGCHQDDSSIDDYCMRLKRLADQLRDIGAKVSDALMLSTLTAGLNEDFGNVASNLSLLPNPTFQSVTAYLRLEEQRMKKVKARIHHTALAAGTSRGQPQPAPPQPRPPAPSGYYPLPPTPPAPPAPQQQQQGGGGGRRNRRRGGGGGGRSQQQQHQPPGYGGPSANISPPRPGPSALTRGPAWSTLTTCRSHGPRASLGRTRPGHRHTSPLHPTRRVGSATPPVATRRASRRAATRLRRRPSAMRRRLHQLRPVATRSLRLHGIPLCSLHFTRRRLPPITEVAVIVKNLVSVRRLARDNPLTVEFDGLGFSVKDARTRMVLHRCDSPDDLYPVHSASTATASLVALAAGVDLWHARLGHPNSTVLRQILKSFSFSFNP